MKTRVRAIIIQDGSILLIHRLKEGQEYWVFPGGGMEESDATPENALERECLEEIGVTVEVGKLFADDTNDLLPEKSREMFFSCRILSGEIGTGTGPEFQPGGNYKGSYGFEWIPLAGLAQYNVKPETIKLKVVQEVT